MWRKRILELAAIMLVGDGVLAAVGPTRHAKLWRSGPRGWRRMMEPFVRRPELTRLLGAAEVVVGLTLASRQRVAFG